MREDDPCPSRSMCEALGGLRGHSKCDGFRPYMNCVPGNEMDVVKIR